MGTLLAPSLFVGSINIAVTANVSYANDTFKQVAIAIAKNYRVTTFIKANDIAIGEICDD